MSADWSLGVWNELWFSDNDLTSAILVHIQMFNDIEMAEHFSEISAL